MKIYIIGKDEQDRRTLIKTVRSWAKAKKFCEKHEELLEKYKLIEVTSYSINYQR